MAKPVITPSLTSAAPGTRITCVATGDITPAYWLEQGGSNEMTVEAAGTLLVTPTATEKIKITAQKMIDAGWVKYPIHASQVTDAGLVTNHQGLVWQCQVRDSVGQVIIGWNMWTYPSPVLYLIDIHDHQSLLYRHQQNFPFAANKVIELGMDTGYMYTFYDGNFLYGDAHRVNPVWPCVARFAASYSGSLQLLPGGGQANFRFSLPVLEGNQALIHLPTSLNMSLNCYDASDQVILDSEATAAFNSRAYAQQTSGAPEMKFTMPAGVTVKKIRVFYQANGTQTLALADQKTITMTGGAAAPLQITAPVPPVTLDPGQTVSVVCNYPSSELVYTAGGGGGSFSGSTYTASQNAGNTYFIHVARGAEAVQLTVAVRAKVTPAAVSMVGLTAQGITINADVTNYATTGWTTDGGTLSAQAIRGVTYTAPNSVGTYHVYAQTAFGQLVTTVTVTASGGTTATGFRLLPEAGYAVEVGAQVLVSAVTDLTPLTWAVLENLRIDGANNNVIIQDNSVIARAWLANAFGTEGGVLEWTLGSAFIPLSASDTFRLDWGVQSAAQGTALGPSIANAYFAANGISGQLDFITATTGPIRTTTTIQPDAGTAMRIQIPNPYTGTWMIFLKNTSLSNFVLVDSFAGPAEPRYVRFSYFPRLQSYPSNAAPVGWPHLTGRWERFYPPNWTALLLNAQGQTIGTLPLSTLEASGGGPNNSFPQQARVTASSAGSGRVSAQYPSGQAAANIVPIAISQTSTALDVIFPAVSPFTMNPGEVITVTANYDPALLSYFASGGGSFGFTPETKNIYTAQTRAGSGAYFDVRKGSEQVRIFVVIRAALTPSSQFASPGSTTYLTFNYDGAITVGATGGTVSLGDYLGGGMRQVIFTAPLTAGTFTITADSSVGSSSATVTVQAQAAINITNTNADVEPGTQTTINTNYPAAEVTFSVSPQAGSFSGAVWTAPQGAGAYTITATRAGAGSDTVVLTVPLRITPKNPASIAQGGQIQFSANFGTVTWSVAPGNGSINSSGLYTAPLSAGQYGVSVNATVGGSPRSDTATVTVSGAQLAVNGPTSVTLQPGQTYRVLTNYPLAEVNYTAVAPGSFGTGADKNLYTAPQDAGAYTAYVARGNESITMTMTVPVVLTPASVTLGNGEVQIFSVNSNVTNFATTGWAATGGTLTTPAVRTVQYNAGTTAGTFGITAITAAGTVTAPITLTGAAGGAFSITYPADPITLNPGATITLGFNIPYDASVTLTATGGSFSGAAYTAPQTAGTYTVTATREGQSDTLTVKIPLVVSPGTVVCGPGARVPLLVNHPSPVFSVAVGAGSMEGSTFVASFNVTSFPQGIIVTAAGGLQAVVPVVIQSTQLVVYGSSTLTLSGGSSYEVSSNVPPSAATYTAFGGHFENTNTYVAPQFAGNYYFTVSYEGQSARIDVFVPLRIQPDVARLSAGQTQQFSVNAPSATWSATEGEIDPVTGFYEAPAQGTVATITATTPTGSDTAQVLLLEEFPYSPTYAVEGSQARDAIVVKLEDGRRHGRAQGASFKTYDLHFDSREQAELEAVLRWHHDRYPERPFLFNDADLSLYVAAVFDSDVRWQDMGECRFNYAFRILETP